FAQADLDTALIPREAAALFHQQPVSLELAAAGAVAKTLLDEQAFAGDDPFSRRDGWRSHGVATRRLEFDFGGRHTQAEIKTLHGGSMVLAIDGASAPLAFRRVGEALELRYGDRHARAVVYTEGETDHVFTAAGAAQIVSIDLLAHAGDDA